MATFLNAWLSSGLLVGGLALAVLAASRYVRNCHVEYCLWLLLLVKLALPLGVSLALWANVKPASLLGDLVDNGQLNLQAAALPKIWIALWIMGSCVFAGSAVGRIVRFNAVLRQALPAPSYLVEIAAELAKDLNIRCPAIKLTDADLPPSMWGFSRFPVVIFPRQLLGKLAAEELRAILAHELTHIRRKDHWIRCYELGVLVVHWWNPVAWWVRMCLRQSEEACCDAQVIRRWPGIATAYASALFTTVKFSADVQPSGATACVCCGDFLSLKQRLEMLLTGTMPTPITILRSALLTLYALLLLPWSLWANTH